MRQGQVWEAATVLMKQGDHKSALELLEGIETEESLENLKNYSSDPSDTPPALHSKLGNLNTGQDMLPD